MQTDYIYLSV
jgi:hypothetical protein